MNFIIYLASINLLCFFLCFIDKIKAKNNWWRIPERVLLFLSFLGGCFGMMIGMYLFHHKTKKVKFYLVYLFCFVWAVVMLYINVYY